MYLAFDAMRLGLAGGGMVSGAMARLTPSWLSAFGPTTAALETFAHATAPYSKPIFDSDGVVPEIAHQLPFGSLLRFGAKPKASKLLIVAPMSGHFATLLRGTVAEMNKDHEVYITDWADAKTVPLSAGRFDLNDYIDYIMAYLGVIGPGAHIIAVCQPSVPVFAATALMNAERHPNTPATLTMMGGPIDTRCSPTEVNVTAAEKSFAWFEQNMITTVPRYYPGGGRKVYPGFLQLTSFMTMNLGSHMMSHWQMFRALEAGDTETAQKTKDFYEEYRAVCDMTAEFYLQTVDEVFQRHLLPKGELQYRGKTIDPGKITRTAILAVEGERDDISGIGQTKAALDLATSLKKNQKNYLMVKDAGHYGIFSGSKWREKVAPVVRALIRDHKR